MRCDAGTGMALNANESVCASRALNSLPLHYESSEFYFFLVSSPPSSRRNCFANRIERRSGKFEKVKNRGEDVAEHGEMHENSIRK